MPLSRCVFLCALVRHLNVAPPLAISGHRPYASVHLYAQICFDACRTSFHTC